MAEVRLSDIIVPVEAFTAGVVRESIRMNAYFNTGVVQASPVINQLAAANQSQIISLPFLGRIASSEPNVSSDDPAQTSTPQNLGSEREDAIKHMTNNSWSAMDLTAALGVTPDPMPAITGMVAQYWSDIYDQHIAAVLRGLVANNVANNASDMVYDISGNVAPGDIISAASAVIARQTLGDRKALQTIVIMSSLVHSNLEQQNLITTVDSREGPAQSNIQFQTFLGMRIIISDEATTTATGEQVTIFTAPGVFQWGLGQPRTPTEIDRAPAAGNGEGQEILHSRQHYVFHPVGHAWLGRGPGSISGVQVGQSPTWAELENIANWDRTTDRKRVPWSALISNG